MAGNQTFTPPNQQIPSGGVDGSTDRVWKRAKPSTMAVFVHAGAGYHSHSNEKVHLEACSEYVGIVWSNRENVTNNNRIVPLARP